MTGLEKILESINNDAKRKAEEIISDAKKEEQKILEDARLKANQKGFEIINNAEKEARDIVSRAKSQACLERKNLLLKSKNNIIEKSINLTKEYILSLDDKDYFGLMLELCKKNAQPKKGELIFSKKDLERLPRGFKTAVSKIAKELGGDLKVSENTVDIPSGFILSYGEIEENCSIDALINEKRDVLEDKLNSLFFG